MLRARWPYVAVAGILLAVAAFAFRRNGFIALGDLWPDPFVPGSHDLAQSMQLWGTAFSGYGAPQYLPWQLIEGAFGAVCFKLGLSGPISEWLFFTILFIFQGLCVAYFMLALFPGKRVAALVAGLALPLSLYSAQVFFSPLTIFAFGYLSGLAGFIVNRLRRPTDGWRFSAEIALASLGIIMLVPLPPMAVYAVLWSAGWLVVALIRWRPPSQTIVALVAGLLLALTVNAWWLFAAHLTLFQSGETVQWAFAGPAAWSWVDTRASIVNLLTMRGLWDWDSPAYLPWAGMYDNQLLKLSLFAPAIFALIGISLAWRKKAVLVLTCCLAASLLLAKGYHPPLQALNAWFYDHIPFAWLFRDPQQEANVGLYLCLFVLAALGVEELLAAFAGALRRTQFGIRGKRVALAVAGIALAGIMLANGAALVTGAFIPASWLGGRARAVVALPEYWRQAADYLNSRAQRSRILVLPNDDFYAMPYTWGYYGIDKVAQTLIAAPVLMLDPKAHLYLSGSTALLRAQNRLLDQMRKGSAANLMPELQEFDVRWIVQRNDIDYRFAQRDILAPQIARQALASQRAIRKAATFGAVDIYHVDPPLQSVELLEANQANEVRFFPARHLLVLATSFNRGWRAETDGRVLPWRHESLGGLANVWVGVDRIPNDLHIVYEPEKTFAILQIVGLLVASACLASLAAMSALGISVTIKRA